MTPDSPKSIEALAFRRIVEGDPKTTVTARAARATCFLVIFALLASRGHRAASLEQPMKISANIAAVASVILTNASIGDTTSSYQDAVLASMPSGYWRFDESSGQALNTVAGSPHGDVTGTLSRGEPSASNVLGYCYRFQAGGISIPMTPSTQATANMTIEFWAKAAVVTAPAHIFSIGRDINNGSTKVVVYGPDGSGKFSMNGDVGGGYASWLQHSSQFMQWHHYTFVHNRSEMVATMFVDGKEADRRPIQYDFPLIQDRIFIGKHNVTGWPYYFQGWIDEVAIYQRALTGPEIDAHFCAASAAPRNCCPGDLNGDDNINGADISAVLSFWGPNPVFPAADIDGDGVVGGADLAVILSSWGPCPH